MNASFSSGCSVKPVKPYITESPEEEENKRKRAGFRRTAIYWRTDITDLRHMGKSYRQMQAFFSPTFRAARNESILRSSDNQIVKWLKRNCPPVK